MFVLDQIVTEKENELLNLMSSVSLLDFKQLEKNLVDSLKYDKGVECRTNRISLINKYRSGLYGRNIRLKSEAGQCDTGWSKVKRDICKEAGVSTQTLENSILISTFRDSYQFDTVNVTNVISGLKTLTGYIKVENYKEDDDLLRAAGVYSIGNLCRHINNKIEGDNVTFEQICKNPQALWKSYLGTIEYHPDLKFVEADLKDTKIDFKTAEAVKIANDKAMNGENYSAELEEVKKLLNSEKKQEERTKSKKQAERLNRFVSNKILDVVAYLQANNISEQIIETVKIKLLDLRNDMVASTEGNETEVTDESNVTAEDSQNTASSEEVEVTSAATAAEEAVSVGGSEVSEEAVAVETESTQTAEGAEGSEDSNDSEAIGGVADPAIVENDGSQESVVETESTQTAEGAGGSADSNDAEAIGGGESTAIVENNGVSEESAVETESTSTADFAESAQTADFVEGTATVDDTEDLVNELVSEVYKTVENPESDDEYHNLQSAGGEETETVESSHVGSSDDVLNEIISEMNAAEEISKDSTVSTNVFSNPNPFAYYGSESNRAVASQYVGLGNGGDPNTTFLAGLNAGEKAQPNNNSYLG